MFGIKIVTNRQLEQIVRSRIKIELDKREKEYEKSILKEQTDLAMLQSQINPHFLYNTLECIRGQALSEGANDIADTVKALSKYFRYNISVRDSMVTIEDEINNVTNYVAIQQYRFKNRFEVQISVDPEDRDYLYGCMIPKLSLQPVIENAIVHGFEEIRSGGIIQIHLKRSNHDCIISVSDNGKGMTRDALVEYIHFIRDDKPSAKKEIGSGNSVGLRNVHRRLSLAFGEGYGVSVSSLAGMGTTVEMYMPCRDYSSYEK